MMYKILYALNAVNDESRLIELIKNPFLIFSFNLLIIWFALMFLRDEKGKKRKSVYFVVGITGILDVVIIIPFILNMLSSIVK